ncbi:MAG: type IV-A pilus assembly ATPase PilB [Candidatus Aureabacteria bacterium]|nr:type IV-A pilus assembly ATPase PilB [Candidatus Auribacterota bacterium]
MAKSLKDRLADILLQGSLITEDDLKKAIDIQKQEGGRLQKILVKHKFVEEKKLIAAIGEHLGIPPLDLSKVKLDPEIVELIPRNVAEFYQLIPIARIGNALSVAMSDPLNIFAIDDLKLMTGLDIVPIIGTESDIMEALTNYYSQKSDMSSFLKDVDETEVELKKEEIQELSLEQLKGESDEAPVIKLANYILVKAIEEKASDIHIEPFEKSVKVRYRVDGVLYEKDAPPKSMQNALISRYKIMAKLDIAERRLPQDGRFKIKVKGKDVDFRVSSLPCVFGEKVVMRILDKSRAVMDIDTLGFHDEALHDVKEALSRPFGMILVTGPTGSGKTTTLYACLTRLNKPDVNIITVEDPVEYQIKGINQVHVKSDIGLTFASALRSILRQDPDIVMIGEIRDLETADIATKAALTGHLVLSTLHTNDAAGAIARLDDMGIEPFLISSSVLCVAAQRLARKICTKCKEELSITKEALLDAQMPKKYVNQGVKLYHGRGCRSCNNIGYSGRMSLLEVFLINDNIRKMIVSRNTASEIKKVAIQMGMKTLRQVALLRAREGSISLEEALRVTTPDEPDEVPEE